MLAITGAWARPSTPGAVDGVVYFTLTSDVDDVVVSVSSDPVVCRSAEIHESMLSGSVSGHVHGGSTSPSPGAGAEGEVSVGPGRPLVLEPGGRHLMLWDLASPLARGQTFVVTLTLESGRTVTAQVVVDDNPPDAAS